MNFALSPCFAPASFSVVATSSCQTGSSDEGMSQGILLPSFCFQVLSLLPIRRLVIWLQPLAMKFLDGRSEWPQN